MKAAVLEAVETHYSVVQAAKAAGVARTTIYAWIATDPIFAQSFQEAQSVAMHNLEGSLYRRAVEKDTIAAIFLLKMMAPERYQDKLQQAHDYRPAVIINISQDQRTLSVVTQSAPVSNHGDAEPTFVHGVSDDTQPKKELNSVMSEDSGPGSGEA